MSLLEKSQVSLLGSWLSDTAPGYLYDGVQIQRKCADDGGDDDVSDDGSADEDNDDDDEHNGDNDDNDNRHHHFIRHPTIVICRTGCKFKGNTSQVF